VSLEEGRKRLIVPSVRISSAEMLRRGKVVEAFGVRSTEETGVRVFDEEEGDVRELRLRLRKNEKDFLLEDGYGTRGGGVDSLGRFSLGAEGGGVGAAEIDEAEEEEESSWESLLGFESEEEEQELAASKPAK
jgi:hypothetical protein